MKTNLVENAQDIASKASAESMNNQSGFRYKETPTPNGPQREINMGRWEFVAGLLVAVAPVTIPLGGFIYKRMKKVSFSLGSFKTEMDNGESTCDDTNRVSCHHHTQLYQKTIV